MLSMALPRQRRTASNRRKASAQKAAPSEEGPSLSSAIPVLLHLPGTTSGDFPADPLRRLVSQVRRERAIVRPRYRLHPYRSDFCRPGRYLPSLDLIVHPMRGRMSCVALRMSIVTMSSTLGTFLGNWPSLAN